MEDFEELILALFGPLSFDRFAAASLPEDRYPTFSSLLSHIRECLDEEKFNAWVTRFIELETPLDPENRLKVISMKRPEKKPILEEDEGDEEEDEE